MLIVCTFNERKTTNGFHRMKEWTEARLKAFIISALRAGSRRYPPKFETLNEAKTTKKINERTGRLAQHYRCKACKGEFPATEIQVDHKKPVVDPKIGFVDWNTYIARLFCKKNNLQILCRTCHTKKTKKEKDIANSHNYLKYFQEKMKFHVYDYKISSDHCRLILFTKIGML